VRLPRTTPQRQAARAKRDVSFSPLAMPMLSGPGAIAVTIGFTFPRNAMARLRGHHSWHPDRRDHHLRDAAALRNASCSVIGTNGMNAMSKVMGFLILCIGIQFVVNGVLGVATDPVLLKSIRDAVLAH